VGARPRRRHRPLMRGPPLLRSTALAQPSPLRHHPCHQDAAWGRGQPLQIIATAESAGRHRHLFTWVFRTGGCSDRAPARRTSPGMIGLDPCRERKGRTCGARRGGEDVGSLERSGCCASCASGRVLRQASGVTGVPERGRLPAQLVGGGSGAFFRAQFRFLRCATMCYSVGKSGSRCDRPAVA
jgi:hypothetical protein